MANTRVAYFGLFGYGYLDTMEYSGYNDYDVTNADQHDSVLNMDLSFLDESEKDNTPVAEISRIITPVPQIGGVDVAAEILLSDV